MDVHKNVNLAKYSTMALGGTAAYLIEISNKQEMRQALEWSKQNHLPTIMIGSGSNLVWRDEGFQGLVLINNILGINDYEEDETNFYTTIGAGEIWDKVVDRSVKAGLTGIEGLSLIPGKTGATPIQNVGAYGQEISSTITTLEAYDTKVEDFVVVPASDCQFGYRTSRFKTSDKGRFYIISITLHLIKGNPSPPFYPSVSTYFEEHHITDYTPAVYREAVISIRQSKLPDPAIVHNVGSFFANPIVDENYMVYLTDQYSIVPHWPAGEGKVKLSAAWLIQECGFKDYHDHETGMSTWPKQPLVLVNEQAKSTADLLKFRDKIISAVKAKFNITLVQEPELLP